jgi:myo-inositol-1(or 4)-monophosphatase
MNYSRTVVPIVKEVGDELKQHFGQVEAINQKSESRVDVVTEFDRKTETFLAEKLRKDFPDIEFVGEESGGNEQAERFWLCDPIDGTEHFIRGLPFCTTMLCLIENGAVIFSVIYDFVRGDMYVAEKGKGAKKNNEPIHLRNRPLEQAYISFETRIENPHNLEILQGLQKKCVLISTINSGFEYAMVAEGKLDGRIALEPYGGIWDYAPGSLLVSEAGGVSVNIGAGEFDYRNLNNLSVTPVVYQELTQGKNPIL